MSHTTPWRKLPDYDVSLPRCLTGLFSQLSSWHEREVRAAIRLQYLYERDKYRQKSTHQMPTWVLEDYGWLSGGNYALPTRNIIKSRVDFITSLLFSQQPRIDVRASGAGYEEQRIAMTRAWALDGTMNTRPALEQRRRIARDGLISNLGACMPIARNNQVMFKRVNLDQLYWDPWDVCDDIGSPPREMHYVEFADRAETIAWYEGLNRETLKIPDYAKKLERLKTLRAVTRTRETKYATPKEWFLGTQGTTDSTDRLRIVHSYRVATSPLKEDGRYVCTAYGPSASDPSSPIDGVVLIDRPFARSTLPIVWWSPWPAVDGGLVGLGVAAQSVELQRALDFSMFRTQQRVEKMGWQKIMSSRKVQEDVIEAYEAEGITLVKVDSSEDRPIPLPQDALSAHDIEWMNILVNWSAGDIGINETIARGGTGRAATASGVAMFEELDRQVDRISDVYESWKSFTLRLGEEVIGAIEDAVRFDKSFSTSFKDPDGETLEYDWADKSLPTAQFVLELEEAGEFSRTRAGRLALLTEGAKVGIFQPGEVAAAMRETPDVRRLSAKANAKRHKIERDIWELTKPNGDFDTIVPTEDDDLMLAVTMVSDAIAEAYAKRAKPETIERLREYRRQAESTLQILQAQQTPPAQPMVPGVDPAMQAPAPAPAMDPAMMSPV